MAHDRIPVGRLVDPALQSLARFSSTSACWQSSDLLWTPCAPPGSIQPLAATHRLRRWVATRCRGWCPRHAL